MTVSDHSKTPLESTFFAKAPFGPGGLVAECVEPYEANRFMGTVFGDAKIATFRTL